MAVTNVTTGKKTRKHGVGRYVANGLLIAFNVLMLVWVISTFMAPHPQCDVGAGACAAAGGLVNGFGVGLIIVIWLMGAGFLTGIRRATR